MSDLIEGVPLCPTVFKFVADLDITGTYPNEQMACNMSKATTKYEVISVGSTNWEERRRLGVSLNNASGNAIHLASRFNDMPPLTDWLARYRAKNSM